MRLFIILAILICCSCDAQAKSDLKIKKIDFSTSNVMVGKRNKLFGTYISGRQKPKRMKFNFYRKSFKGKIRRSVNSL